MWWAVSFDFHLEAVAILFAVLLARDLANGRRRAWAWVAPLLACGDVAGTYLAGLGLGGVLAGRRSRLRGAVMALPGRGRHAAHHARPREQRLGGGLQAYAHLTAAGHVSGPLSLAALAKGSLAIRSRYCARCGSKRVDVLANLAPAGLVGLAFPRSSPSARGAAR